MNASLNDGYSSSPKPYNDGYGSYDDSDGTDSGHTSEQGGGQCPRTCDVRAWPRCQCVDRDGEMFTRDGRGNCNVGATKQDRQVLSYYRFNSNDLISYVGLVFR